MNVKEFCLSYIKMSEEELFASDHGDLILWYLARLYGSPNELHGGVHRHNLTVAVLSCIPQEGSKMYMKAIDKTKKWIYVGARAATIGCVRNAIYNAWATIDMKERLFLYLIQFAANYNMGYSFWTAYDDAFFKAIKLINKQDLARELRRCGCVQ